MIPYSKFATAWKYYIQHPYKSEVLYSAHNWTTDIFSFTCRPVVRPIPVQKCQCQAFIVFVILCLMHYVFPWWLYVSNKHKWCIFWLHCHFAFHSLLVWQFFSLLWGKTQRLKIFSFPSLSYAFSFYLHDE